MRVLVTAGGTREAIDPVRFIGNRSSGKQGYAIAHEAVARGALVTLVTTVRLEPPPGAEVIRVESAADLQAACEKYAPEADFVVMSAAVADFRPKSVAGQKIKKTDDGGVPTIELERTPDILAGLGAVKPPGQVLVGFAAARSLTASTANCCAPTAATTHSKRPKKSRNAPSMPSNLPRLYTRCATASRAWCFPFPTP